MGIFSLRDNPSLIQPRAGQDIESGFLEIIKGRIGLFCFPVEPVTDHDVFRETFETFRSLGRAVSIESAPPRVSSLQKHVVPHHGSCPMRRNGLINGFDMLQE